MPQWLENLELWADASIANSILLVRHTYLKLFFRAVATGRSEALYTVPDYEVYTSRFW